MLTLIIVFCAGFAAGWSYGDPDMRQDAIYFWNAVKAFILNLRRKL